MTRRTGMRLPVLLRQPPQPAQHRNRALAVGLHREPEPVPGIERRVGEDGAERLKRRLEPILLLGVDRHRRPARPRRPRQAHETRHQLLGEPRLLARLEARMQRRQLHRQTRALVERVEMHGGERPRRLPHGIDRRHVALVVEVGILLRLRRLAQHVVGEEVALRLIGLRPRQRLADGAARARTDRRGSSPPGARPGG